MTHDDEQRLERIGELYGVWRAYDEPIEEFRARLLDRIENRLPTFTHPNCRCVAVPLRDEIDITPKTPLLK